jgi:hypothetical protein
MREDPPVPVPPPLPATHPTQKDRWHDGFRYPFFFYLEVIFAQLALVILVYAVGSHVPWVRPAALFGQPLLWFFLMYRLARRVIDNINARGKPRFETIVVFLAAMLLPALGAFFGAQYIVEQNKERPRSDEARAQLLGILQAERQFRKDFGRYTLNARELGYQQPDNLQPHYVIGFATACSVKVGVSQDKAQWIVDDPTYIRSKRPEIDAAFLNLRVAEDCKDPKDGFEAFAVGAPKLDAPLDIWSINEKRALVNRSKE